MHFRGPAIVPEADLNTVYDLLAPHRDSWFDWFRVGGRYDGYLVSDAEMERRSTEGGLNFGATEIESNHCRLSDLPRDRRSFYFFVSERGWVSRELYNQDTEKWVSVGDFQQQVEQLIDDYPDHFAVVIDAHG